MVFYLSASSGAHWQFGFDLEDGAMEAVQYEDTNKVDAKTLATATWKIAHGYRVRAETLPSRVTIRTSPEKLPDVLAHFVVSDRFRALVERFEPGIHQFVPVEVRYRSGGAPSAAYYWFNIGQRLDSVDREHTTFEWKVGWSGEGFWTKRGLSDAEMVFSRALIGDHHLWLDPHALGYGEKLCSTSFGEAAIAAGLSGLAVTPRKEV